MTVLRTKTFDLDTWSKGTRGREYRALSDLPLVVNMRRTSHGAIQPRSFWRLALVTSDSSTTLEGAGPLNGVSHKGLLVGGKAYAWVDPESVIDHTLASTAGTLTIPTARLEQPIKVSDSEFVIGTQLVDTLNSTLASSNGFQTDLDTIVGATWVSSGTTVHQGRLFSFGGYTSGGREVETNRLYYSDSYDYMNIASATQFIDVDGNIEGILSSGSNLLIWTQEGKWHILQGRGNPANGTLSYLGNGPIPSSHNGVAEIRSGFVFSSRDNSGLIQMDRFGTQDSVTLERYAHSTVNQGTSALLAYLWSPPSGSGMLDMITGPIRSQGTHMVKYKGMWSVDLPNVMAKEKTVLFIDDTTGREVAVLHPDDSDSGNWEIYSRNPFDGAIDGLVDAHQAESSLVASVETPYIREPDKLIRVEKVYVDVVGGGQGLGLVTPPVPSFTIAVLDGNHNDGSSLTIGPGVTPLQTRMVFENADSTRIVGTGPPRPFTEGLAVWLNDIKGVNIGRITVVYSVSEGELQ
jgi:hypothetical protein